MPYGTYNKHFCKNGPVKTCVTALRCLSRLQHVADHKQAVIALRPFTDQRIFNSTRSMREALELLNAVLPLATVSNNFSQMITVSVTSRGCMLQHLTHTHTHAHIATRGHSLRAGGIAVFNPIGNLLCFRRFMWPTQ